MLLGAVAVGAGIFAFAARYSRSAEPIAAEQEKSARMAVLQTAAPADFSGGRLSVLCDRLAAPYFCEENAGTLAARVKNRNAYFALENDTDLSVEVDTDVFDAAQKDMLSGEGKYTLYAASAAGTLTRLLAHGLLADASPSLAGECGWLDREITDALRIGGKPYLFSSAILSAETSAAVLQCGKAEMAAWLPDAQNGALTVDTLRAAFGEGWLAPTAADTAALYTAFGGKFVFGTPEGDRTVSYADFVADTEALCDLYPHAGELPPSFTVVPLGSLSPEDSFLPMPKRAASDPYASYITLAGTPLCAIPVQTEQTAGYAALLSRFGTLSEIYIRPKVRENVTGGDPAREALYDLVTDSTVCDLSALLGYGDIPGLLTAIAEGCEPQPALQYYNRIALYEKALSILEKRATAGNAQE